MRTLRYVLLLERCNDQSTLLPLIVFCCCYFRHFLFHLSLPPPEPSVPQECVCSEWHVCGNNEYEIPQELVFVRDLTLKGKVELFLFLLDMFLAQRLSGKYN